MQQTVLLHSSSAFEKVMSSFNHDINTVVREAVTINYDPIANIGLSDAIMEIGKDGSVDDNDSIDSNEQDLFLDDIEKGDLSNSDKERGQKSEKRKWGTGQKEAARETNLHHYNTINQADHMVKNASSKYITWKYWHSPYLHALSLGVVVAYDMYLDCAVINANCEAVLEGARQIYELEKQAKDKAV